MFAETLRSLTSSNKDRIPFAQGRYNMGGSGSLRFCGPDHLQLIVSRRNPHIPNNGTGGSSGDAGMWGFTVLRREPPRAGHQQRRNGPTQHPHRHHGGSLHDQHPYISSALSQIGT